ncbi:MAG: L-rhamnose isomerase, partial [Clostridiales bacterium]|nr:L-rhamnose isomerase [Clostridiales bacterium]
MSTEYKFLKEKIAGRGMDPEWVKKSIKELAIETPSWGYGDSGTRFKVFKQIGMPRNLYEKLDDAAIVNKFTGVCPSVAVHIPWDKVDDYEDAGNYARQRGIRIGAVNPNLFQNDEYMLGSVCNSDPSIRKMATDHMIECVDIARKFKSKDISLWFADGTNYPGQGSFRARKNWMIESLLTLDKAMDEDMRMFIEYKAFEPAFYHTDIADWGMSLLLANKVGKKGTVLVDLGHHAQEVNIEYIVANLIDEGKMGGFHFNNKKYADDDLIVGSIKPYELFLIFNEIIDATLDESTSDCAKGISYMIDQCHSIEPKVPAMIRSVLNVQTAHAKALLVDRKALYEARMSNDVMGAEACVRDAFETDVRPLLEQVRIELGIDTDPMKAYMASGHEETKKERGYG